MLMRIWSNGNSHSLLVGMQNGIVTLEDTFQFLTRLNVFLLYDPVVTLLGIYPNVLKAQHQKNMEPDQRTRRRSKQTFLQRRHANGQQAHEKMLNNAHHQRNANQNHLTPVRMVIIKKNTNNKF